MDRAEPEPLELVLKVMGWGALSIIPVACLEAGFEKFAFCGEPKTTNEIFVYAFFIGAVEEMAKLFAGLWPVWNDPNFNEENDGIVYVSASSLGFAGIENFCYVIDEGFGTGILRAILSVPGHLAWGAMMGYYAGLGKFAPAGSRFSLMVRGYLFAVIGHGLYDAFLLSNQTLLVLIIFFGGPVFFWRTIRRLFEAGKTLSLARIAENGGPPEVDVSMPEPPPAWKWYVSRLLFWPSYGFWCIILIGLPFLQSMNLEEEPPPDIRSVLLGSVILTAPPLLLAWLLSGSYWQQQERFLAHRPQPEKTPA